MSEYRCTRGHDRCDQMIPGPECPYCEPVDECIGADPLCPCQDGDPCHYVDHGDTKGWSLEGRVRQLAAESEALQQQVEQLQRQNRDAWQKAYALAFQVEQLEQQVERLETDLQDYRHLEADLKAFIESRPPPKKPAQPRPDFIGEQPENSEP